MATIAKLVIEMAADPQGVRSGLDRAEGYLRQFGRTADQALATAGRGAVGTTLADNIIGSLQDRFRSAADTVKEQLFRGVIDPKVAADHAREAAQAMNATILATLGELRGRGLSTPELEHDLIAQLSKAGLAAGTALGPAAAAGVKSSNAGAQIGRALGVEAAIAGEVAGEAGGRTFAQSLTATVHRHRALIPTLAGLILSQSLGEIGTIAESAEHKMLATEKAAEKIIENFAMLASFLLEPIPGLIAAVAGGSIAAIIGIFTKAQEKMIKFREEFKAELDKMVNDIDQLGLQKKLKDITVGQAAAGPSTLVANAFKGGLNDLIARQNRDRAALATLETSSPFAKLTTQYTEAHAALADLIQKRGAQIQELKLQAETIRDAILNPVESKAGFGGQLPAVITKANAPGKDAKDFLGNLEKQLNQIEQTRSALTRLGESVASTNEPLVRVYKEANKLLEAHTAELIKQGKVYDDQALRLEEIRSKALAALTATLALDRAALSRTELTPGGQSAAALAGSNLHVGSDRVVTSESRESLEGRIQAQKITIVVPPQASSLPTADVGAARVRVAESLLSDAVTSVAASLRGLAENSVFAILRSIAGQLNPFAQVISAINSAAAPLVPFMTRLANVVANTLGPVFEAFAPVLEALLPLIDAVFRVLSPILRAMAPLLQAFVPILVALFPVFKAVAIAATYVGQAFALAASFVLRASGNIIATWGRILKVIAEAVDSLPFVSAHGAIDAAQRIIDFGNALVDSADDFKKASDALGEARSEIEKINIDPTQTAIDALGTAANKAAGSLLNVPQGYKVALARFNATAPTGPAAHMPFTPTPPNPSPIGTPPHLFPTPGGGGTGSGGSGGGSGGGGGTGGGGTGEGEGRAQFVFGPGSVVIQGSEKSADELFTDIVRAGQQRARATFGDSSKWSLVQVS